MKRLALAALLLAGLAAPAAAYECTEVDGGVSRAGVCADEPCTVVWVDPLRDLQDEGVSVGACAGRDGTSVCYATGRRYECVV